MTFYSSSQILAKCHLLEKCHLKINDTLIKNMFLWSKWLILCIVMLLLLGSVFQWGWWAKKKKHTLKHDPRSILNPAGPMSPLFISQKMLSHAHFTLLQWKCSIKHAAFAHDFKTEGKRLVTTTHLTACTPVCPHGRRREAAGQSSHRERGKARARAARGISRAGRGAEGPARGGVKPPLRRQRRKRVGPRSACCCRGCAYPKRPLTAAGPRYGVFHAE